MTDRPSSTDGPSRPSASGDPPLSAGRTIPPGVAAIVAAVMLGLLVVAAAWGYGSRQEADRSHDALVATQGDLASSLSELAEAQQRASALSECVGSWQAAIQQARAILDLEEHRYALLQTGSTWATAFSARDEALRGAIDDYYEGYLAAYNGNKTKANTAIRAGNTKIEAAKMQLNTMTNELAKIGDTGDTIATRLTAFTSTAVSLTASCTG